MQFNNLLIAATLKEQEQLNISDFIFEGCTGVKVTEFISNVEIHNLKAWVRTLSKSHLLVTVGDWAENQNLQILVDIARKLDIKIVPSSNFKKYVSEKND